MTGQIKVSLHVPMHERVLECIKCPSQSTLYDELVDALDGGDATWLNQFTAGFREAVYVYMMRHGLMRRLLANSVCNQGQSPRIPIRNRSSSIAITQRTQGSFNILPSSPQRWCTPAETHFLDRHSFKYIGAPNVIYQEFSSAIRRLMTQGEQKTMFNMARQLVPVHKVSNFDLTTFDNLVQHMTSKGTKVCYAVVGFYAWTQLKGYLKPTELNPNPLDPICVADRNGVAILSENSYPWLNFGARSCTVGNNEFFLFTDALNVGAYTDRDGISTHTFTGDAGLCSSITTTSISIALTNELGIERGEII